jgi:hypothetical protein
VDAMSDARRRRPCHRGPCWRAFLGRHPYCHDPCRPGRYPRGRYWAPSWTAAYPGLPGQSGPPHPSGPPPRLQASRQRSCPGSRPTARSGSSPGISAGPSRHRPDATGIGVRPPVGRRYRWRISSDPICTLFGTLALSAGGGVADLARIRLR